MTAPVVDIDFDAIENWANAPSCNFRMFGITNYRRCDRPAAFLVVRKKPRPCCGGTNHVYDEFVCTACLDAYRDRDMSCYECGEWSRFTRFVRSFVPVGSR